MASEPRSVCLQGPCFTSLSHLTVSLPWDVHASRAALSSEERVVGKWDLDPQRQHRAGHGEKTASHRMGGYGRSC